MVKRNNYFIRLIHPYIFFLKRVTLVSIASLWSASYF